MANASELYTAASSGEIDTIYRVIGQDPRILEEIDAIPFVNTPLHTAASAGRLEFSIEMMRLKPSFGSKLNQQGYSPIHIALQNNQHNLVRRLVEINKELVRVKGKEGFTPLHFVCESGDSEENITLLFDLLVACPDSIKDVNVRNETALHISLNNKNLRALRVLLGWLKRNTRKGAASLEHSILNWKNSDGNTILHIATLNDNNQAVNLLKKVVKINAKNLEKKTALDCASPTMRTTLLKARAKPGALVDDDPNPEDKLISKSFLLQYILNILTLIERSRTQISKHQRNSCLVVATLFVTAIYNTSLNPPGGLTQSRDNGPNSNNLVNATSSFNSTEGKSTMSSAVFGVVSTLNAYILVLGVYMILLLMPSARSHLLVSVPLLLLLLSYLISLLVIDPEPHQLKEFHF